MNSNRTKKQKLRQNSFAADFNVSEDDLILADLDVMLGEDEPSPVPLNHFPDDEETIDRLFINSGFEANNELEKDDREPDALMIDDINFADDFSGFDQFVVEPIEQAEQHQQAENEEIPDSDFHLMVDFDEIPDEEDAIDRVLANAGFDGNIKLEQFNGKPDTLVIDDISLGDEFADFDEFGVNIEEQNAMTADAGIFDSDESDLTLDKDVTKVKEENLETSKQEQTISETIYQDVALERLNNDAGLASLRADKSEQEAIKRQINDYENKVKKAAIITYTSLSFGILALLSTVVMGVIVSNMQTKVSKLTELVSILEDDMSSIAGKNSDLEISNSDSSVEQLNQKFNGLPEQLEEQTQTPSDISENVKTTDETKQATVNKSNDKQQTQTPLLENKHSSEKEGKKVSAEKKENNTQPAVSWFVNLTAYEDLSYAKSKAEKFIQKGIPVKVIAVDMNNKTWYRLRVGGFKNKEEATSYADKIKKSLNLNTVLVGKS
jgi:cell division septation protein DedD